LIKEVSSIWWPASAPNFLDQRRRAAERLAFVLLDLFSVPFEEIAGIIGRSEPATRQLASRARRRPVIVNGGAGAVALVDGRPVSVAAFTVAEGRIVAMDILADPSA
jgi:hypothetical protein